MDMEEELLCELCGEPVDEEYGAETGDGWICEDCASLLSPWMEDLEFTDTEDLEDQIAAREQNLEDLQDFVPTRSFYIPGMDYKLFLDDETGRFLVTEGFHILDENPDILSLEDVMDASVEVEDQREDLQDDLYLYSYNLYMHIELDHPYLSNILIPLNREPLTFESSEKSFLGFGGFDPSEEVSYRNLEDFGQDLSDALLGLEEEINHRYDVKPGEFCLDQDESEEDDPEEESDPEDSPAEAPGEGDVVICPWCGCRTHVTRNFRCEHCDGNL